MIPLLCVHWTTPDDGQRDCPKHVEFYSKNKSEKLVHLVCFITRNDHDARSSERRKKDLLFLQVIAVGIFLLLRTLFMTFTKWRQDESRDTWLSFNAFSAGPHPTHRVKFNAGNTQWHLVATLIFLRVSKTKFVRLCQISRGLYTFSTYVIVIYIYIYT